MCEKLSISVYLSFIGILMQNQTNKQINKWTNKHRHACTNKQNTYDSFCSHNICPVRCFEYYYIAYRQNFKVFLETFYIISVTNGLCSLLILKIQFTVVQSYHTNQINATMTSNDRSNESISYVWLQSNSVYYKGANLHKDLIQ